jgi:sterol desaturase/sphingolipid hydroxylase (fatty acid hydroxylase superfamily)
MSLLEALLFPLTNVYSATLLPALAAYFTPASLASSRGDLLQGVFLQGVVPCVFFYGYSFFYFLLDTCTPEGWLKVNKFQGKEGIVAPGSYGAAYLVSLRSWFVGLCYIIVLCKVGPALGLPVASAPWSAWELLLHFPVFLLTVDACFFTTHRILHLPFLFRTVHSFHHSFSAPFAVASVYAHPFEHLFSNVLSISLGPILMRSHPITAAAWGCLTALSTCNAHSGFRFSAISEGHDWHHREAREMFGAGLALLDQFFHTNTRYLKHSEEAHRKVGKVRKQ